MRRYIKFSRKHKKIEWVPAADVKRRVISLINSLEIDWIQKARVFCFRSENANTRAIARIWGFSKIWQMALKEEPAYVVEVVSEKYDRLSDFDKDRVLLHEITHIPKSFSGSLLPHIRRGKGNFEDKVRILIARYKNKL